ncbi:MAG: hypothetical protein L0Y80_11635 [Ignavibacteriae bacterium]|nr:hypothetical protein [Ignavibacteriota bacterium]
MGTLQELEQAVSKLPEKELARFREWFEEFDAAEWDKQFEQDVKAGKLDRVAEKALTIKKVIARRCEAFRQS